MWQLWADSRKLERWWGPPSYPATVEKHDLSPGGDVTYFMTGPDGEQPRGWWRVTSVNPPKSLEFTDGFANQDGTPNVDMPITRAYAARRAQRRHPDGVAFGLRVPEQMEQLVSMGVVEGLQQAVGQMDALLAG